MFRWITNSRLRTALAILFFCFLFALSIALIFSESVFGSSLGVALSPPGLTPIVGLLTAVASLVGTISTVLLAWRADPRTAKESDLKLIQLQQQIVELQLKLKSGDGG